MGYIPLGYRPVNAAADTTGQNAGNWTAVFESTVMRIQQPVFECYHLYVKSPALVGQSTTADMLLNGGFWETTLIGQRNSWDPNQPLLMTPGDTMYVFFNVPTSTTPAPIVYAWFRYET